MISIPVRSFDPEAHVPDAPQTPRQGFRSTWYRIDLSRMFDDLFLRQACGAGPPVTEPVCGS